MTNKTTCQSDPARSHAFITHLRESIKEHAELSYLATTKQDKKSCATFWGKLVAKLENRDTKLGRECHMIHKIMDLKCSEISEFGEYYRETLS